MLEQIATMLIQFITVKMQMVMVSQVAKVFVTTTTAIKPMGDGDGDTFPCWMM